MVRFQEKWVTLDNRRLRAFMDAMIAQVPAQVCSLNDPQIYREFHEKRKLRRSEERVAAVVSVLPHARLVLASSLRFYADYRNRLIQL